MRGVQAPSELRGSVLVVEDEPTIADVVARYLRHAGYVARVALDGRAALAALAQGHTDLVVLDIMLPGIDGLEVLRRVREADHDDVAIILLSAKGEERDRVLGLRAGADDYLVKPFSPAELLARVEAVLRRLRARDQPEPALEFDGLHIDVAGRRVLCTGEEVALTQREFDLLAFLASHPGRVFSRDQLMDKVWQYAFYTDTATVTVHVRRLRAKLERDPTAPRWVQTVWGVGYRFQP